MDGGIVGPATLCPGGLNTPGSAEHKTILYGETCTDGVVGPGPITYAYDTPTGCGCIGSDGGIHNSGTTYPIDAGPALPSITSCPAGESGSISQPMENYYSQSCNNGALTNGAVYQLPVGAATNSCSPSGGSCTTVTSAWVGGSASGPPATSYFIGTASTPGCPIGSWCSGTGNAAATATCPAGMVITAVGGSCGVGGAGCGNAIPDPMRFGYISDLSITGNSGSAACSLSPGFLVQRPGCAHGL